jgi:hypothetical protein
MERKTGGEVMNKIWVIERLSGKKWLPTVGVAISHVKIKIEKKVWERKNPDNRFRIQKYVNAEERKEIIYHDKWGRDD